MVTAQDAATAAIASLNVALSPKQAFDLDKVPSPRPAEYVEATLSRLFGGQRRQCGSIAVTGYRLTVRALSQTSVGNVRRSLEKCRAEIEFARLAVGDETSTPIQFETEDPIAYDDGWFDGLQSYTFAI